MTALNGLMAGKKGLVMGVANERSIAWGIAKACHDHGEEGPRGRRATIPEPVRNAQLVEETTLPRRTASA